METVPGDKISMSTSQMLRFAPMIAPIMHQVSVYTHFYFVPNRITWPNWQDFITGGEDGLNASVFPTITFSNSPEQSLLDYMGLPAGNGGFSFRDISALPFAAYQKIYNEYYRDQNLQTASADEVIDGDNAAIRGDLTTLRTRAWQHDYFTSALPWTQKGAEATIPIGVVDTLRTKSGTPLINNTTLETMRTRTASPWDTASIEAFNNVSAWEPAELIAEATSINDLRNAFRLQEWLEKNARGGSRYIESILVHFGVKSSDARQQRPEFLGGGSAPITISEVLQSSSTATEPTPQGNMSGHGISVGQNSNFSYYCEEHGYIIGIMSIMPKTAYQQGVPKHFTKFDKFDYYWPSFAHLGEQPITMQEIYFQDGSPNNDTFGYTPRYAEYKYLNSSVHGAMRSTLDFWHLGRKFATPPALNSTFIQCTPDARIFAVVSTENLYCHLFHSIKATRKMPYFGTPKF
jgi:hypothetical protein